MHIKNSLLAFSLAAQSLTAPYVPPPATVCASQRVSSSTIVSALPWVVGDSYGEGISAWGQALRSTAVKGKTIPEITKQLKDVPPGSNIVVSGGTNDGNYDKLAAHVGENAETLLKVAKEHNLNVVSWVGPTMVVPGSQYAQANPKFADNLQSVDKTLKNLMTTRGISYKSLHVSPYVKMRRPDGLHFDAKGFASLRRDVLLNVEQGAKVAANPTLPTTTKFAAQFSSRQPAL